ncbi:FadR/GntR family transcriptional regulator [Kaistia dalseonensis]|uniref:GntR family galactonate operon transcriptional repressor n=1 Tax=Kaistia dalseonensis TaxID=410840 RepID=A0ABU0H7G7_9HYPH|nr:FadR/GntR family transcriptional regulator [Kaistia dalseonensis]MCX5494830.1 FadR/GntR family transcriptional regulator [Kaistia dalseonensis]MDQ0437411.1 GntR family galactonate operon transcriptional repressor [Kaistia dalseonensis]
MLERELSVGTMSAQVANHVGARIVSGEFLPGSALPIESELCEFYGVSRTTVREAVKSLAGKRLVEVSPKIGTRVLPFSEWNLLDREVLAWRLQAQFDGKIVEDIFEMRLCFEPRASFLAARDGTAEDHALIEQHFRELVAAHEQGMPVKTISESALEFHLAIINASHNGLFVTIGSAVKSALRVSSEMLQRHATRPSEDVALHDAVRTAIVARKPKEAASAMEYLLAASRERLLPLTVDAAE